MFVKVFAREADRVIKEVLTDDEGLLTVVVA